MRYNHFMNAKPWIFRSFLLVVILLSLGAAFPTQQVQSAPPAAPSAADLMAAVQALRAKQGLPPLIVDSALMFSAQKHSEYQASIGTYSHIGAGGTRAKDRAIAAGFGGGATVWMSENVAMAQSGTSLDVVLYQYWGDPDHWNTMTNPRYIYGGSGVAVSNGIAYYTLNTGYTTGGSSSGITQTTYVAPTSTTPLPTLPLIYPVITSTKSAGDGIIHVVRDGQTLIGIAQAYKIALADLKKLNNLTSDIIFTGQKLVIQPSNTPAPTATITRTLTVTPTVTSTALPTRTATLAPSPTLSATPTPAPALTLPSFNALDRQTIGLAIVGVCAVGLVLILVIQFRKK